jgi:hypothetical protein
MPLFFLSRLRDRDEIYRARDRFLSAYFTAGNDIGSVGVSPNEAFGLA